MPEEAAVIGAFWWLLACTPDDALRAEPERVDMGVVWVDTPRSVNLVLEGGGRRQSGSIDLVDASGWFSVDTTELEIPKDGVQWVQVRFAGESTEDVEATLVITGRDPETPLVVPLSASAILDGDRDGSPGDRGDCDDGAVDVHPGATDLPYDGVDADCDGSDDYDVDGDGHRAAEAGGDDCDDTDPLANPDLTEVWYDGVDGDCSGGSDFDQDGDGQDAASAGGDDCDDLDPTVSLGATEIWYDGIRQGCGSGSDFDQDHDGDDSADYGGTDCDDLDPDVWPGAAEVFYDGIDADCAGDSDYDQDLDGYEAIVGDDCDDLRADVFPGNTDPWGDGLDADCSGPDVALITAASTTLYADLVDESALTVWLGDSAGTPAPDGTVAALASSLGRVELGATSAGTATGRIVAGNVPGTATLAIPGVTVGGDAAIEFIGGTAFSVQMHLHGPISEDDGTYAWQIGEAQRWGVDALWWTDHDYMTLGTNWQETPPLDDGSLNLTPGADYSFWEADGLNRSDVQIALAQDQVVDGANSLSIVLTALDLDPLTVHQGLVTWKSTGGGTRRVAFGQVEASVSVWLPSTWDPAVDTARVVVGLSAEGNARDGQTELVYLDVADTGALQPTQIGIPVSLATPGWNTVTMPLTDDVVANVGTLDMAIDKITIQLGHKGTGGQEIRVDGFSLVQALCCEDLVAQQRLLLDSLDPQQDIVQFIGQEISNDTRALHLNAFGEGVSFVDYENYVIGRDATELVALAHAEGAVVSYNHMFGVEHDDLGDGTVRADQICEQLVGNRAYGADLLEVGYPIREYTLPYHLMAWDCTSTGGGYGEPLYVTGTGTSDMHRNEDWDLYDNPFVTWVWARELTEDEMLSALLAGRAFFGDPTMFPGQLVEADLLAASGAAMGQVVSPSPLTDEVTVRFSPVVAGQTVKLIGNNHELASVRVGASGDYEASFTVDTSRGVVVRAELWSGADPLLFTNPIYYRADVMTPPPQRVPQP